MRKGTRLPGTLGGPSAKVFGQGSRLRVEAHEGVTFTGEVHS